MYLLGGQEINYENLPINPFTLEIKVRDYLEAENTFTLFIYVTDVNEPPSYDGVPDALTANESMVSNFI